MDKKIKLLFIHHKLVCGGAEQALFDLVSLLDKQVFDITIFVEANGGEWEEKFRELGIRVETEEICQKKSRSPFVKLSNWAKRKRIARCKAHGGRGMLDVCYPDEHFDLIIAYHSGWNQNKCFRKGSRIIKYIHGDVGTLPDYRTDIERILPAIPEFDCCICVSEVAKQSFMKMTGRTENVYALFNPLNSDHVQALAEEPLDLGSDVPTICAVGRLSHEKGFDRLIKIHKRLLDKGYVHKLVIVGDGPERANLENAIRATGTQESVHLAGYQSNPYPYMKNSHFVVCSSYSEGLSMIAIEALVLGIPVVSAVPSIGELLGDELCGLVTENDDDSLEAGIEKVLADEAFYQQLKAGAQRRSAFFDGRRMVSKVEKLYIDLANKRG